MGENRIEVAVGPLRDIRTALIGHRKRAAPGALKRHRGSVQRIERMVLDPDNLLFLYQGISNADNRGDYGRLPYRLGLLRAVQD